MYPTPTIFSIARPPGTQPTLLACSIPNTTPHSNSERYSLFPSFIFSRRSVLAHRAMYKAIVVSKAIIHTTNSTLLNIIKMAPATRTNTESPTYCHAMFKQVEFLIFEHDLIDLFTSRKTLAAKAVSLTRGQIL